MSVSECRCGHRGLVSRWTSAAGHAGPPEGSAQNITDRARSHLAYEEGAVTATRDTIYTGSGSRGCSPMERNQFVTRSMDYLIGAPSVSPAALPANRR